MRAAARSSCGFDRLPLQAQTAKGAWPRRPTVTARHGDEVIGAEPSVQPPISRRGRTVGGVSHVWHAPCACRGHPHERARHARIAPLVRGVIFGLGVHVLRSRRVVLEGWDRSNAVNVCAEAVDHSLPTICRFATYSGPRNLLSRSLLGMKTRSCSIVLRVHGFSNVNFRTSHPAGLGSM
jgi:hypothetical protein